ncbi:MAG: fasciclin domain-containing protein [Gemmatimonadetes bacterium]|nr:fasciclin domain-containing protein [Gemmatimonadota bacterium]
MKIRLIAFMAIFAIVVAACSDSDEAETTTTTAAPTETTEAMEEEMTTGTIVDVAIANEFNTLVAAVQAAGLVETLSGEGPFTVFAPTDEAFEALPEGTLEGLLEDPEALAEILTYHVVSGRLYGADLLKEGDVGTLEGRQVDVRLTGGRVLVGDAQVVSADIDASNGVVHVIDAVLIPGTSAVAAASAMQLIERAISLGAPLFNGGEAEACADVYLVTAEALLRMRSQLPADVRDVLRTAVREAEHEDDAVERAWILRRGLDATYDALGDGHNDAEQSRTMRRSPGEPAART